MLRAAIDRFLPEHLTALVRRAIGDSERSYENDPDKGVRLRKAFVCAAAAACEVRMQIRLLLRVGALLQAMDYIKQA